MGFVQTHKDNLDFLFYVFQNTNVLYNINNKIIKKELNRFFLKVYK